VNDQIEADRGDDLARTRTSFTYCNSQSCCIRLSKGLRSPGHADRPDNRDVRYSLACALSVHLKEADGALDLLGPYFAKATEADAVTHAGSIQTWTRSATIRASTPCWAMPRRSWWWPDEPREQRRGPLGVELAL